MTTYRGSRRHHDGTTEGTVVAFSPQLRALSGRVRQARQGAALNDELHGLGVGFAREREVEVGHLDAGHFELELEHLIFFVPEDVAANAINLGRGRFTDGQGGHTGEGR